MSHSTIRIGLSDDGIATLTLARPAKHNALNAEMITELTGAAGELGASNAVRVVVLTGEGESFCAGGDLEWMRAQFKATRLERMSEARKLAHMLRALNDMPKPLIASVNGAAYGGGVGMTCVADNAICSSAAKFGLTETRLGLIPATISPYVTARLGEGATRRVFMSARIFGADEAQRLGLVGSVVAPADLAATTQAEARAYLAAAPAAIAAAKALARRLTNRIDDSIIEDTISRLADTWETAEAKEGIAAFFDKRKPSWNAGG
jgi:methylglutaconyl-CoA hydratase